MDIDIKINMILSCFMSFIKIYLIKFKFRLLNLIVKEISYIQITVAIKYVSH